MTFMELLERHGWPGVIILGIGWFFYNRLWPTVVKRLDCAEGYLKEQVRDCKQSHTKLTDDFLNAIERRDAQNQMFFSELQKVSDNLEKLTTLIKDK